MNTINLLCHKPPIERTSQNIRIIKILSQNVLLSIRPNAYKTGDYSGMVIYWGTIAEIDPYALRGLRNLGEKSFETLMAWLEIVKRDYPELLELHTPAKANFYQLPECPICRRFHEHGHIDPALEDLTIQLHGKTYRLVPDSR